ncbi:MAG: hypothetical protein WED10_14115 [Brumimicrobium sp.]
MTDFLSDIPIWVLIFWAIFTLGLSIFYYRPKKWIKDINRFQRFALIGFRFLGLFIIGILLLGILVKSTAQETDKPSIITIVDDSKSMLNYSDSSSVKLNTKAFLDKINNVFGSDYTSLIYTLDSLHNVSDSMTYTNDKSNISEAIDDVYNNYYGKNIGAVILLSDGNYNAGTNPTYITEKFKKIPFYTVGVGDTLQKTDHFVSNIVANEIAFLDNQFPIEVTVEGNLTNDRSFNVVLYKDGKKVDSEKLTHADNDYSVLKTKFLINADEVGVHHYVVKIDDFSDEYNLENNEKSVYVEVLDDRSKVLLLAEGIHPDMGAIKNALDQEQNIEVESKLIKDTPSDLSKYDLIIWHSPGLSNKSDAFNRIVSAEKPIWYIIEPSIQASTIQKLNIASNVQTSSQSDRVGVEYNLNFTLFDISKETKKTMEIFPPLNTKYGKIRIHNSSSVFGFQKVGEVVKPESLYFFGKQSDQKFAVTYGTGIWSWKLADYQKNTNNNAFNEIVSKSVQYLVVKENTSRLRVHLPAIFDADEDILIGASFYNESLEPITTPSISFELTNENGDEIDYSFLPLDKKYSLDLGRLKPGAYKWVAHCKYNDETFTKKGAFVVRKIELESQDTKANHALLNQIATNSNGSFYTLENYSDLIDDINERDDISSVSYEISSYKNLIDYFWWFVLLVFLFGTEWLLRRYFGGY